MIFNFMNNYYYIYALAPKGAGELLGDGTPHEIIIHVQRNHCTKFVALIHSIMLKTIRHQIIILLFVPDILRIFEQVFTFSAANPWGSSYIIMCIYACTMGLMAN